MEVNTGVSPLRCASVEMTVLVLVGGLNKQASGLH
jgi:hypothetical protein